jgi:phage-related protein
MSAYSAVMTIATVAQTLYAIATGTATAAQLGLDVALSPVLITIGAFVIVIAALAAGLIYAYTQSETFRNVVNGVFGAVKDFVVGAVDTIKGAWDAFVGGFQNPGATIGKSVDTVSRIFLTLGSVVGTVVGWFQALPGRILAGVAALPGLLWAFIKTTVEKAAYLFGFGLGLLVRASIELPQKIAAALIKLPGLVWDIIKTVATKGAQAFASFVTAVVGKAIDLASQVPAKVSAMVAAVVGFLRGLPAKAVAAIKALPGLLKAAVSDAGKWLLDAGKAIVQGAIDGIKNAAGAAVSAVKDLGGQLASGFAAAIGFNSPAKRFIPMGSGIVEGVEVGLKSRAPAVYDFMERFAQRIGNIKVTAGVKSAVRDSAITNGAILHVFMGQLDTLRDKIKDQRQAFADLVKARNDYANSLTQGITGGGSIAGIQLAKDETDSEGNVTKKADKVGSFVADLKAKAEAIRNFNDNVSALRAAGLSQAVLQQIQAAGLETGGALATALTAATPDAIKSINDLGTQITDQSTLMGKGWASDMYDSGIKAAKGLLQGLQSEESQILKAIRQLAQNMVAEIKRTLKIKSPSGVMADEVGAQIAAGLAAGIRGGAGGVASAMRSLVAIPSGGARIGLGGSIASTGGGGGNTHVHLHVPNGFVGSPDQLATALSDVISRAKARGLNLSFA